MKPKRILAGLLAMLLIFLTILPAHPARAADIADYGDAQGHWAYDALAWAVNEGVVVGTSENEIDPDGYLTRAQMAAMIDRLFGTYKSADISRYTDVSRGSWYYDYIAQAVNMGTFNGYSNSRMGPDDNITREQAMTVLARTICLPAASREALAAFPDRNDIGAWAHDAIAALTERGYISGYANGWLKPKNYITRAEMVQIMCSIFQSIHDSGEITGTYQDAVLVRGKADIHDAVFEGDLILANGLGEKSLDLNNITVKGRLVVWGGSEIHITGNSTIAGVVTPRNDNAVRVAFDGTAAALSQQGCSVVYPDFMDKGNKVVFGKKPEPVKAPTIAFDLPPYLYVGDSATVKTTITDADAVTWTLTRDGQEQTLDSFSRDGGVLYFMKEGTYVLQGVVTTEGGSAVCERTVEVLPIGDIAFSLPEYSYTDTSAEVALLREKGLEGNVAWTLEKDGEPYPAPDSFDGDGGTLALSESGSYTLTATLTDAAGKKYTHAQTITILPVIVPTVTASADKVHEDETVEIGLSVENGENASIHWDMACNGESVFICWAVTEDSGDAASPDNDGEDAAALLDNDSEDADVPVDNDDEDITAPLDNDNEDTDVTQDNIAGTLAFDCAGDYILTAIATDAQGREFPSEPVSIRAIENLTLSLTVDAMEVHEDETAAISLTVENGEPATVEWAMTHDGEDVPVSLDDSGGTLSFEGTGSYVLTAIVTDELDKTFTAEVTIQVYPVIVLALDVPEDTHADQPAVVDLTGNDLDGLTVEWEITSEEGTIIDTGLTNEGGEITFPSVGTYTVTASVTDALGRTFSASGTIQVWSTMRLSFRLPEFAHTDETVIVKMASENLEQHKVEWSLTVCGEPVPLSAGIKGSLDNGGGSVKFLRTGTNVLTASVMDDLGRTFTYEQAIAVYPVLHLELTADAAVHTDRTIHVELRKDADLPVAWCQRR